MDISIDFPKGMEGNIRLDQIEVCVVDGESEKGKWDTLVKEHHYLRDATLCGPQIRYAASCRGKTVALISFSIAAWHLSARDKWIGWDERQRLSRLGLVVQNSRFLIMPGISTPNLASRVLSLVLKRLPDDWMERHGKPVLLVETFVDKCFPGTSYRADNWKRLGETRGFSRGGPDFYRLNQAPKTLWVKELVPGAAEMLGSPSLPPEYVRHERPLESDEQARVFTSGALESLYDVFNSLSDGRRAAGRRHRLASCLAIVACGFLVGCGGLGECAELGRELKPAQMRALRMRRNPKTREFEAPCHNTLWRVMEVVDTTEFEAMVAKWHNTTDKKPPAAYALDGKTLRNSVDSNGDALHVVSVISHEGSTPFLPRRRRTTKEGRARPQEI
jgi:hypothetical protein